MTAPAHFEVERKEEQHKMSVGGQPYDIGRKEEQHKVSAAPAFYPYGSERKEEGGARAVSKKEEPLKAQKEIPHFRSLVADYHLFAGEGYNFIRNHCRSFNSDIFSARLMLGTSICIRGEEAAKMFYTEPKLTRKKAIASFMKKTIFGEGGVHSLDGQAHFRRKELFLPLLEEKSVSTVNQIASRELEAAFAHWTNYSSSFQLLVEVEQVLTKVICEWAGVPLRDSEISTRAADFANMVDAISGFGPQHWRGRQARKRCEKWLGSLIEEARAGPKPEIRNALIAVATHESLDGSVLPVKVAAVELLNILRPYVAIGRFLVFAVHALAQHPVWREKLVSGGDKELQAFELEVRRFYPFTPLLAANVDQEFVWNGYHFPAGDTVLLDIYGTNHDERIYPQPEVFKPDRFYNVKPGTYSYLPQGGGDPATGHRCPGERLTIGTIQTFVQLILNRVDYEVPSQDMNINLNSFMARPDGLLVKVNRFLPAQGRTMK